MKQADDVEENPGPARCDVCERTFAAINTPLSCAACGALAHGSCSGMTRARRSREEPYTCKKCGGERRREECLRCRAATGMEVHRMWESGATQGPTRGGGRARAARSCTGCPPDATQEREVPEVSEEDEKDRLPADLQDLREQVPHQVCKGD